MTEPVPPPEAVLIRRCREAKRPKLSMNAAAKAMKFSGSRWRQIENGYQTIAAGVRSPVVAPAETLAHMAEVVGATPDQLEGAGRKDAAELMRDARHRLGQGLASLIPTGPTPGTEVPVNLDDDPLSVEKELLAQGWKTAHDLTDAVTESDPSEPLLAAARDAVRFIASYLIMRILNSGHAAELENWLARIYREREVFYQRLSRGEPQYPWAVDAFESPEEAAAYFVRPRQISEEGDRHDLEVEEESPASTAGDEDQKITPPAEDRPPTRAELDLAAREEDDPKEDEQE